MPEIFKIRLLTGLAIAFFLLPAGIVWFWRKPRTLRRTSLRALFSFLFSAVCTAFILLELLQLNWLELEWRGGYVPVVTWTKTHSDIAALEKDRQAKIAEKVIPTVTNTIEIKANWPGFRGPNQDGTYRETAIITNWPASGLKLLWRQACGGGYSSFAIAGHRAFTLEQRRGNEVAAAYDLETGRELWTNGWPAKFMEYHSDEGPRSTPAYDEGKVYTLGGTGEFRCLDAATGATVWGTNIMTENASALPDYGIAASPLIAGDKIILQPDAYHGKSVVCYDKHTGRQLWHALDLPMGYATPLLVDFSGEAQVVVCGRPYIYGLRLADGVERWRYTWHIVNNERPITEPLLLNSNTLFLSAAYMTGCASFTIDRDHDEFAAHEVWKNKNLKTKFASAVIYNGYIYGLDEDILVCLDAQTGERKWKDGRYGYGQLLLAGDNLIVLCADGHLALIKATPDALTEVARFPALNGKSWNAPAIGAGKLLVRNGAEMACYEISSPKP